MGNLDCTIAIENGKSAVQKGVNMEIQWDWILWAGGALVAVVCLVNIANLRRKPLQGLLREYVERQVLWVRRKVKAAEIKSNQQAEEPK